MAKQKGEFWNKVGEIAGKLLEPKGEIEHKVDVDSLLEGKGLMVIGGFIIVIILLIKR